MPELTIQVHDVTDQPGTTLVTLNGSIDAKTVITFQTHLNTVKERGASRLVLDMENVKYVNSTGLGFLINLSDSISSDRGEIALVKVQPRVKVVLDMLGLNSFFKIYSTCEEALKQLLTDGTVGADDPTRLVRRGEGSPFGAAPEPSAPVALSHSDLRPAATAPFLSSGRPPASPATLPAKVGEPGGSELAAAAAERAVELECEACRTPLTLDEPGAYECPRCQSLFRYEGGSRVVFLPPPEASPIRLSLGFSEEATEGLLGFVRAVVRRAGFSETEASSFEAAVKEVVQAIRRIAYDGRDNQVYHVLIVRSGSEVELHFADSGSRMVSDENGEDRRTRFAAARAFMDRFEIKAAARGGNVVTLTKKMKSG